MRTIKSIPSTASSIKQELRKWESVTLSKTCRLNICCVSVQGLHPSEEHLKTNYVTTPREGCPDQKAPNAAHECSFCSLFLEDASLRSFMASNIPRVFSRPKKKKEREKMATSRGVDRHIRGLVRQKSWCKCKTSGEATRKCSKGETVPFNNCWRV